MVLKQGDGGIGVEKVASEVRVDILSVVLFELAYGAARSAHREQNAERVSPGRSLFLGQV